MRIAVKLFGPEAIAAGMREAALEVRAGATVREVRSALASAAPALAERIAVCRFAVNHEFADEGAAVEAGDEVALIGPVSGG